MLITILWFRGCCQYCIATLVSGTGTNLANLVLIKWFIILSSCYLLVLQILHQSTINQVMFPTLPPPCYTLQPLVRFSEPYWRGCFLDTSRQMHSLKYNEAKTRNRAICPILLVTGTLKILVYGCTNTMSTKREIVQGTVCNWVGYYRYYGH